MEYIDVHGHVSFPVYDADRALVIERAHSAGVGMITVGTDLETSKQAIELAEKTPDMWAIVGLHPVYCGESHNDPLETGTQEESTRPKQQFDYEAFKKIGIHPRVVAIGECGLDFFHSKPEDMLYQKEVFEQQIQLAQEVGKPLMLHVRNSTASTQGFDVTNDAYVESLKILQKYPSVKANFHFFAGGVDVLKTIISAGYYVSFTGVLTFAKNYEEVVRTVPLDRIMIETDCPYVAPVPYRGKRNEPSYVVEVIKAIARIRGEDEGVIRKQVMKNTLDFFAISNT